MHSLTNLYNHQKLAIEKLKRPKVGALFMEMGTGKTRTAIELVLLRQERIDQVIWFCPVSLKETIFAEIHKHVDSPDVYMFDHKTRANNIPQATWYIVGLESMSSSTRVVVAIAKLITNQTFIIVDESSYIKGYSSRRTHRITELGRKSKYRLILSGTPMSQGIVDLYSQMRFLSPYILGYNSFYSFARNHLEYSEKYPGLIVRSHNTEHIAAKIQPYVYQVTKGECLDLPKKLYDCYYFSMTEAQMDCYWQAKQEILTLDYDSLSSYMIFRIFTTLQQIVSGFWNRRDQHGEFRRIEFDHDRINTLLNVIQRIPDDAKIIIWCKYQYSIESIKLALGDKYGEDQVAAFYGRLNEHQRNRQIEIFKGKARFLVATQQCGGHGLNLTEATYAIFYENEFKYANRLQAEDRIHRIGQEHPVTYIDIICDAGIDRKIAESQSKKGNVIDQFKREIEKVKDEQGKAKFKRLIDEL